MLIAIHVLCALTALGIALVLFRSWRVSRSPMQLHVGLCFAILTVVNFMVVLDRYFPPANDWATLRLSLSVLAIGTLLYGLLSRDP